MRQAGAHTASVPAGPSYQQPYAPVYGPSPYMPPSQSQQWDWRDYFITAVVSGSVAYGAMALARKYLLPHLQPPTSTAYEQDRDALTAQFDAAEALLKEIQAETAAVKLAVEDQKGKVDKAVADVEATVKQLRDGDAKTRDEMREIREEINNVREMLPKMIDKNKETHTQSLAELQQELKSLKALLLSRGPSAPSTPIPPPSFPQRPSIPAWQLAPQSPTPPPAQPTPQPYSLPSSALPGVSSPKPISDHGKGKEVEAHEVNGTS